MENSTNNITVGTNINKETTNEYKVKQKIPKKLNTTQPEKHRDRYGYPDLDSHKRRRC